MKQTHTAILLLCALTMWSIPLSCLADFNDGKLYVVSKVPLMETKLRVNEIIFSNIRFALGPKGKKNISLKIVRYDPCIQNIKIIIALDSDLRHTAITSTFFLKQLEKPRLYKARNVIIWATTENEKWIWEKWLDEFKSKMKGRTFNSICWNIN